jgi:hypothetical protein
MKTIFVPDYEWNSHYNSPEECVLLGQQCGDFNEGDEFKLVRLEVGACTTYRVVNGKPVPVVVAFPAGIESESEPVSDGVMASDDAKLRAAGFDLSDDLDRPDEKCDCAKCKAYFADGVGLARPTSPAPEDSYPDQTILHAEGACGNCLQATIAGILGWPLAAVPHFAMLGEDHWWDCAQAWLNSQGYWIDYQPTSYAAEGGELLPRCWLSGRSPRGFSHAVVGDAATLKMLHDPHPSRAGLVEHSYTIYFFRKPAERNQR